MVKEKGHLIVISGPSGVGKGTLIKIIFKNIPNLSYSVSVTTRKPRKEEREGVDYFFVDERTFKKYIEEHKFAEWAMVHGDYKGTLISTINETLAIGQDLILEIDVQGALKIKNKYPEGIFIFIAPPSWEKLEERLRGRSTEDEQNLKKRLNDARCEMEYKKYYDYVVVNDELEKAAQELEAIIVSERSKCNK